MPSMPVVPSSPIEPATDHAGWRDGLSLRACGLTAGAALPFSGVLDLSSIVMLFLLTVVLGGGLLPGAFGSVPLCSGDVSWRFSHVSPASGCGLAVGGTGCRIKKKGLPWGSP